MERMHDFGTGLLSASVNLREASDWVNRYVLLRILALSGIPPKLVKLASRQYSGTESAVRHDGTSSDYFLVDTEMRHGCVLATKIFKTYMNHVLGRMSENSGCRLSF